MTALCPSLKTSYFDGCPSTHLVIVGSTGSIGQQALQLIKRFPGRFVVEALSAGKNISLLAEQVLQFNPRVVCVADEADISALQERVGKNFHVVHGAEGLEYVSSLAVAERVLVAASGSAGIVPAIAALKHGKLVALANKECVVAVPELMAEAAAEGGGKIIPVDSEHSALFQLLLDKPEDSVHKLILTASGGPFLGYTREKLAKVSLAEALQHPRWSMGSKITVDSASMMNKAFELIEAVRLFGVDQQKVQVLVHPESIIHGALAMADGSLHAHASVTDMAAPIGFGLTFPGKGLSFAVRPLDLASMSGLHFLNLDESTFKAVGLARAAVNQGSQATAVLHIANECIVEQFLAGNSSFLQIVDTVTSCLEQFAGGGSIKSIEEFTALYGKIKEFVRLSTK